MGGESNTGSKQVCQRLLGTTPTGNDTEPVTNSAHSLLRFKPTEESDDSR
jgi:hypothetical protein